MKKIKLILLFSIIINYHTKSMPMENQNPKKTEILTPKIKAAIETEVKKEIKKIVPENVDEKMKEVIDKQSKTLFFIFTTNIIIGSAVCGSLAWIYDKCLKQ